MVYTNNMIEKIDTSINKETIDGGASLFYKIALFSAGALAAAVINYALQSLLLIATLSITNACVYNCGLADSQASIAFNIYPHLLSMFLMVASLTLWFYLNKKGNHQYLKLFIIGGVLILLIDTIGISIWGPVFYKVLNFTRSLI